jgi:hypothetical protein
VGAQFREAFGIEAKVVAGASPFLFHQGGGFQHLQVLGNSRPADGKPGGKLADRSRPATQQLEHGLPRWIGEGGKHLASVSHTLR